MGVLDDLVARVQKLEALVQQALSSVGKLIGISSVQAGSSQLINGAIGIILGPGKFTANSRVIITMKDALAGGGAITNFASFDVPSISRNYVVGGFIVRAIDDTDAQIGTAQCSFDYVVVTN
jgi:hypothetical protein